MKLSCHRKALFTSIGITVLLLNGCDTNTVKPIEDLGQIPTNCEAPSVFNQAEGLCELPPVEEVAARACVPEPFPDTPLYMKGSMNGWGSTSEYQFRYNCDRYELVADLIGEQTFKIADEHWSSETDWGILGQGALSTQGVGLSPSAGNIVHTFTGQQKLILDFQNSASAPILSLKQCSDAPFSVDMFIRGSFNGWAANADTKLNYLCDAYYINVDASGAYEFKIADEHWSQTTTLGGENIQNSTVQFQQVLPLYVDADLELSAVNLSHQFGGNSTVVVEPLSNGLLQLFITNPFYVDTSIIPVTNEVALSAAFDSRNVAHKSPFGAVPAGQAVEFTVTALPGIDNISIVVEQRTMEGNQENIAYLESVETPMLKQVSNELEHWSVTLDFPEIMVYGYYFKMNIDDESYILQNNNKTVYWTLEKGAGGLADVAVIPSNAERIRRFRHSSYDPNFEVPEWSQDAIYYYIFPERFRNGDVNNDVNVQDSYYGYPVELHDNWLNQPWVPGTGDGSDDQYNNDFFGGDLAGIIEKLQYIADLGANTIYMTPIFEAPSNHKYDTDDYKSIDNNFGTNELFLELTAAAEVLGIRVILDTSLNHTGSDSKYFDRYGRYDDSVGAFKNGEIQTDSPFYDWYEFYPDAATPDQQYEGWVGFSTLPNLKESDSWKEYAFRSEDSVMKMWLDLGADGWRMDVAPWVSGDFWREWRTHVKEKDPQAITIAETWFDAADHLLGDMFDSTMNYIFRNAVQDFAAGESAVSVYDSMELMRESYPPQAFYSLMNLLSTHDAARSLHYFGYSSADSSPEVIALAKQRLKLAVLFQMAYPGAPAIFYGDEVGLTGGNDPYNRAAYPWADRGGNPDLELLEEFKGLIAMRTNHDILRKGSIDAPVYIDENLIVLQREFEGETALLAFNNAQTVKTVSLSNDDLSGVQFTDLLSETSFIVDENGTITFDVPAVFGLVLISK